MTARGHALAAYILAFLTLHHAVEARRGCARPDHVDQAEENDE